MFSNVMRERTGPVEGFQFFLLRASLSHPVLLMYFSFFSCLFSSSPHSHFFLQLKVAGFCDTVVPPTIAGPCLGMPTAIPEQRLFCVTRSKIYAMKRVSSVDDGKNVYVCIIFVQLECTDNLMLACHAVLLCGMLLLTECLAWFLKCNTYIHGYHIVSDFRRVPGVPIHQCHVILNHSCIWCQGRCIQSRIHSRIHSRIRNQSELPDIRMSIVKDDGTGGGAGSMKCMR